MSDRAPTRGKRRTGSAGAVRPTGLRVRLRALYRAVVITWQFVPLLVAVLRDRRRFLLVGGSSTPTGAQRYARARDLKETFVDLGPAFIKLGQLLSTRPDALPPEYVEVLSELQDRVPPAEWDRVEPVLSEAVGPVAESFDRFDRDPISGASLGQVYEARLDGERVAVKVLRPDVRTRVESDLRVLSVLVPALTRFAPPGQAFTLSNLAAEFAVTIREEMDYAHEAESLRAIGANFADDPDVVIPEVIDTHSTDRVLTMTHVEGTKIDEVAAIDEMGVDRERVVRTLTEAYIRMIVEDGRFHADPHPGNLAVQADGSLVLYDFGMTGELGRETREHLVDFYVGIATDDIDRVIDSFVAMGALDPTADRAMVRRLFEAAFEQFRGADVAEFDVADIVAEFEGAMYEFPMRIPQDLAHVVRVTTVLDGVTHALVPDFDFIAVVTEYVREEWLAEERERVGAELRADASEAVRASTRVPPRLETALARVERGDLALSTVLSDRQGALSRMARRLTYGLTVSAGLPVVAFLHTVGAHRGAAVVAGVTALAGGLLWYSFRARRGPADVRAGAQVAGQRLGGRRRE